MPRITFIHSQGKSGEVPEDVTVLEAAEMLGFPMEHD